MSDFTVFDRQVLTNGKDSLFVRLTCSVDSGLLGIDPVSVDLAEGLSYPSPMVSITFVDMVGDLFNTSKIDPDSVYWLYMGRNEADIVDCPMKATKIKFHNQSLSKSEDIIFTIQFAHIGWYEMVAKKHNRSWSEVRISDVVTDLVTEGNYTSLDIMDTPRFHRRLIQPHWSNIVFMNWLRKLNDPSLTDQYGHIEYGSTLTGKFIFKTLAQMVNQQSDNARNGRVPVLRLRGQLEEDTDRMDETNAGDAYFVRFDVNDHYMNSIIGGSGGIRSLWYDSEIDEFYDSRVKYSNSNSVQMTEFGAIKDVHETTDKLFLGGRDRMTDARSLHEVSNAINSTVSFDVILENTPRLNIGDMVEVVIPTPYTDAQDPFNSIYSGFYIVGSVIHSAEFAKNTNMTKLTLIRSGYDSPDLEGYVSSSTGRFI